MEGRLRMASEICSKEVDRFESTSAAICSRDEIDAILSDLDVEGLLGSIPPCPLNFPQFLTVFLRMPNRVFGTDLLALARPVPVFPW